VNEVTEFMLDVDNVTSKVATYVVPSTYEYDMILGRS
jgi:hypothetical protein